MAMGKKRMCRSADVATDKMRIYAADIECGCVGKKRVCGRDLTFTLKVSYLFVVCLITYKRRPSLSRMIGLCASE